MPNDNPCLDCGLPRSRLKGRGGRGLCHNCWCSRRRWGTLGELPKRNLSFEEHLARVVPDENGCWPWPGFVNQSRYGVTGRHTNAHVRSYEYFIGPVPEGHDVGHLCHDQDLSCQDWRICTHRQCVNPAHLKPMTRSDNLTSRPWRKQFCIRGHELSPENVYIIKQTGGRQCVPCKRMLVAAKREKINARKRELAAMKRAVVLLPTQRVATDSPISEQLHLSL